MRWFRLLLAAGATAVLLLPAAASADTHVGLHDMTCTGISAMGRGLPQNAPVRLMLHDEGQKPPKTLAERTIRTSATGSFDVRLDAPLYQVLHIHLVVARQDGTKIAMAEHVMAKGAPMCDLPFTGPRRPVRTLLLASALLAGGVLLLTAASRWAGRPAEARPPA